MRTVVSMNSFKGSLTAVEASQIVGEAVRSISPSFNAHVIPICDGGTGSLEVWSNILDITPTEVATVNALGEQMTAPILIDRENAYIEMAQASGLHLFNLDQLDILHANTVGTGHLIVHALQKGARNIYLGLGGSATHDLGTGILQVLGVKFKDESGNCLKHPHEMTQLATIDSSKLLPSAKKAKFYLLCDVNNPLVGCNGAAHTFAPQKGATDSELISRCENISHAFTGYFMESSICVGDKAGDGAAGGIPTLLKQFLCAEVISGSEFTVDLSGIRHHLQEADLLITGEGSFDPQTYHGKGPGYVIKLARREGAAVIVLAGAIDEEMFSKNYLNDIALFSIVSKPTSLEESMKCAEKWLDRSAKQAMIAFHTGYKLGTNLSKED